MYSNHEMGCFWKEHMNFNEPAYLFKLGSKAKHRLLNTAEGCNVNVGK